MKNKVLDWFVRIPIVDKAVHLLGEVWPDFLKPTVCLRTLRCIPPVAALPGIEQRRPDLGERPKAAIGIR